jgi:cellulose synthase/poly-beta-1,6-N-acetylglucosamine synthase-like glycosyltransferase
MAQQHRSLPATRHPFASVVIPVGDIDDHLIAQVRAVLAQETPFGFDVVLSCNAADRQSCAELDSVPARIGDPRLRVVAAHGLRSAAHARNVGARSSGAAVLAFCDADDLAAPGWLAALVAGVSDDVAVGGYLDEKRFALPRQEHWRPAATPGELPAFLGAPYLVSANMALARSAFERAGGFDESLVRCEDIAMSWRLRASGVALEFIPAAVVHYRHRAGVLHLMKQHYLYGRGMAQVLHRYEIPHDRGAERLTGLATLRPNAQPVEHRTFVGTVVRRGSIAAGRVVGLADERRHQLVRG